MLWNGSSAGAYSGADKAVLLQDPVRPWLYPKSRTRVWPERAQDAVRYIPDIVGKYSVHFWIHNSGSERYVARLSTVR